MKTTLISKRLLIFIGISIAIAIIIKTIINYTNTRDQQQNFAKKQAQTLNTFMLVHRNYYINLYFNKTIPINQETLAGLPAFSAFPIAEQFSHENIMRIRVQTVSDRARNPKNKADSTELEAMNYFRKNSKAKEYFIDAGNYYQYATPLFIQPTCLKCHGKKEDAPDFIQNRYAQAYDYHVGDLRGLVSIKVPKNEINHYFMGEFLKSFVYDAILLLIIFGLLYYLIRYFKGLASSMEQEIDERGHDLRHTNALFKSFIDAMNESSIVSKSDLKGNITYVNDNFTRISGYSIDEVIGKPHNILRHPDTPKEVFREIWGTIQSKRFWKGIFQNRTKNGNTYWIDATIMPILDEYNEIVEYVAIRHEITELIEQREVLRKIAYTHPLTNLPNRTRLIEDLALGSYQSIALFDLNRFSQINDVYGQDIGDKLLVKIGDYLRNAAADYSLYHLNGDEFAILDDTNNSKLFIEKIQNIVIALNTWRFTISLYEIMPNISAGIASNSTHILSDADIALKLAKKKHKDCMVYDPSLSLDQKYADNLKCITDIENALLEDRFLVYYQKIIDNKTHSDKKHEALVRMISSDGKILSPFYFLDVSKQSKQYDAITRVVIKKVFHQFATMDGWCSINLTIEDIVNPELRQHLIESILMHGIGPKLIFELVESEGIENFDTIIDFIDTIKGYGCRIAIDDFGTGYSNFEYLMRLKADFIKIDGSIIKNILTDPNAQAVIKAIVFFAKECGIQTIAEFVETEEIYNAVCAYGIDYSQGYYFSKPAPIEETYA